MNENSMRIFYQDGTNEVRNAFALALANNLFSKNEPYMYMGQDAKKIYFKNADTRKYLNLVK